MARDRQGFHPQSRSCNELRRQSRERCPKVGLSGVEQSMRFYEAAQQLKQSSSLTGRQDSQPQDFGERASTNAECSWHNKTHHHAMTQLCMTSKKRLRSSEDEHHWHGKKRSRTLCANTTTSNASPAPPSTMKDLPLDQHPHYSLQYVGLASNDELQHDAYEWRCNDAACWILISQQGTRIRLRRLWGTFQSTSFLQVLGNNDIVWVGNPTPLEHIAQCLMGAVQSNDVENYLSPGRFRLGYEEESSMLIS